MLLNVKMKNGKLSAVVDKSGIEYHSWTVRRLNLKMMEAQVSAENILILRLWSNCWGRKLCCYQKELILSTIKQSNLIFMKIVWWWGQTDQMKFIPLIVIPSHNCNPNIWGKIWTIGILVVVDIWLHLNSQVFNQKKMTWWLLLQYQDTCSATDKFKVLFVYKWVCYWVKWDGYLFTPKKMEGWCTVVDRNNVILLSLELGSNCRVESLVAVGKRIAEGKIVVDKRLLLLDAVISVERMGLKSWSSVWGIAVGGRGTETKTSCMVPQAWLSKIRVESTINPSLMGEVVVGRVGVQGGDGVGVGQTGLGVVGVHLNISRSQATGCHKCQNNLKNQKLHDATI